jgi:hypothetical protein
MRAPERHVYRHGTLRTARLISPTSIGATHAATPGKLLPESQVLDHEA